MEFFNTGMLIALPFGLVPIIIYYLMRFRSLKVTWGAEYVLMRALERLKKRLFLEQLLLLAVRVFAAIALTVAFARPVTPDKNAIITSSGVHHILLVDGSYSMLAGGKSESRWERSRAVMRELVGTWGRGEKWSLYLVGEEPRWAIEDAPVDSAERSVAVLDALAADESSASLAKAIGVITERHAGTNAEVYVFADDQAVSWRGVEEMPWDSSSAPRVYWINPPLDDRANLAVTAVRFGCERVLLRHPCPVFVSVRNFGAEPAEDAAVDLLVDGSFHDKMRISLLPGQEGWVRFDVVFDEAGPHRATGRVGGDALSFDDEMAAGCTAIESLRVVVLRDAGREGKFDSAWSFLEVLHRVQGLRDADDDPAFTMGRLEFAVADVSTDASAVDAADVVVLDGAQALTTGLVRKLHTFVTDGGGLLLAADAGVKSGDWNERLGGAGLLPARLARLRAEPLGGERYKSVAAADLETSALRSFESDEDGDLSAARFYTWFDLEDPESGAECFARFSDGRSYAVRKRFDRGAVVLLAAGLNSRGNNLAVREFSFPFLFRLVAEAAAGGSYPRTLARSRPIRLRIPNDRAPQAATLSVPGRPPVPLRPTAAGDGFEIVAPGGSPVTGECSLLVVGDGLTERVWYGVQGERTDSDLTPIELGAKRRIAERLGLTEVADWPQLDEELKASRRGTEWHLWAVIAALLLLVGEMVLQRRFT